MVSIYKKSIWNYEVLKKKILNYFVETKYKFCIPVSASLIFVKIGNHDNICGLFFNQDIKRLSVIPIIPGDYTYSGKNIIIHI